MENGDGVGVSPLSFIFVCSFSKLEVKGWGFCMPHSLEPPGLFLSRMKSRSSGLSPELQFASVLPVIAVRSLFVFSRQKTHGCHKSVCVRQFLSSDMDRLT